MKLPASYFSVDIIIFIVQQEESLKFADWRGAVCSITNSQAEGPEFVTLERRWSPEIAKGMLSC